MRAYDGILPTTVLTEWLLGHFALSDPGRFMDFVYLGGSLPVDEIAGAAPIVLQAAEKGDAAALAIVKEGARSLSDMVRALAAKMGLEMFHLGTAGGLIVSSAFYRGYVAEELARVLPGVSITLPLYEPCVGAMILSADL